MPRVAIFGVFDSFNPAYSLSSVETEQVEMLAARGYPVRVLMLSDYAPARFPRLAALAARYEGTVTVAACIPRLILPESKDVSLPVTERFHEGVAKVTPALMEALEDIDVCITHDIIFQTWFLIHNLAMREVAERLPKIRWLHWVHSAPSARPKNVIFPHIARYTGMANSKYIFLNRSDAPRLADMLSVPASDVLTIPNSRDILDFLGAGETCERFIRERRLLERDAVLIYPARFSSGKQPDKVVRLAAGLAYAGVSASVVFANSYSQTPAAVALMEKVRGIADAEGLTEGSINFTSEFDPAWRGGIPSSDVRTLMQIADVFVIPSLSEAHSLITMEAALARNLIVLNGDFPAMLEWLPDGAMYGEFGSTRKKACYKKDGMTEDESERWYFRELAWRVKGELESSKPLTAFSHIKRNMNKDAIFRDYIEPLLWRQGD
jgi:glycosyltransferase involved in cell wall biosynthesis